MWTDSGTNFIQITIESNLKLEFEEILIYIYIFNISLKCARFCFLYPFTKMKAYPICTRAQAFIFTVLWSFSQTSCQSVEEVWTIREQVVKSKDFRRQTKEWMAVFFFTTCVRNVIKKSVGICVNNSMRQKGTKKKIHIHNINKFWAQRYGYMWATKAGRPWREKGGAHFIQAWC